MKDMRKSPLIIVTGGAGFIGSCFLWQLNQKGLNQIILIDESDSEAKEKNLRNKQFIDYIDKKDFIAKIKKNSFSKGVQAVFHIGACSSTTETSQDYLWQNNLEYSKTLCQWSLENNALFYYASSAAAYGNGSFGYSDDDKLTPKLKPLNLYGQSKQLFDLWAIENKIIKEITGFRYFNVFGPNEYHKKDMRSLVVKAFEQIKKDKKIRLFKSYKKEYADGEQKRDFIYIKDVIDLMWQFYQAPHIKGIYNLGAGKARTWNDLAKAIFTALNLPVNIEYIDMPKEIKDKYQYFTQADLTKLKSTGLKYNPLPLEESVKDYVINYLEKGFACL